MACDFFGVEIVMVSGNARDRTLIINCTGGVPSPRAFLLHNVYIGKITVLKPYDFQVSRRPEELEEKYTQKTTVDTIKDEIVEAKKCDDCDFIAKDEFELQQHKQEKKHFTDE